MCFCIKVLFALVFPPMAVLLDKGCNIDFLLNILLTCIGYLPGMIHALFVICRTCSEERHSHHIHTIVSTQAPPPVVVIQEPPHYSSVYGPAPPPYSPAIEPSAPPLKAWPELLATDLNERLSDVKQLRIYYIIVSKIQRNYRLINLFITSGCFNANKELFLITFIFNSSKHVFLFFTKEIEELNIE